MIANINNTNGLCLSGFILVTENQVTVTNIHTKTKGHRFRFNDTKIGNHDFTWAYCP